MRCVNCGQENLEKALICYWCGMDPITGESPYLVLKTPSARAEEALAALGIELPPPIQVPPPMPVPEMTVGLEHLAASELVMPDLPVIEITPSPEIPTEGEFVGVRRRRASHRPLVRAAPVRAVATRPVLPVLGRLLVFLVGLGVLFLLGSALVTAVGAASLGNAFCLLGLLGAAGLFWLGALLARSGQRAVERAGVVYERLETLGQVLREVAPGVVKELPVNLPTTLPAPDLPAAYSELRALAAQGNEPPLELAVDLLTGALASLVARDDVVLARRTYSLHTRGLLARAGAQEVNAPVLTRRRAYVGPGQLEGQIVRVLRTDRPMTVEELMQALVGSSDRRRAQQLVQWVYKTLEERPPNLETLALPDEALVELQRYREAIKQADPELYKLLEVEIRRGLGAVVGRAVPSSLLDLAQYAQTKRSKT